jgi:3-deoxy-D-manno-octulosonic-acid transferase
MSGFLLLLYQILGSLAFVLALPYLVIRSLRHPQEMRERLGWSAPAFRGGTRPLWLHAASLGELEAIRGLLQDPHHSLHAPVLLTVLSVSARRKAVKLADELKDRFIEPEGADAAGAADPAKQEILSVMFAPVDLWFAVLPFLCRARPRGLLLVETELWPFTLSACRGRRIPTALISGRLSPRKWGTTRRLRPLLSPLLRCFDGVAAQTEADGERFRALGARRIRVTGNLKYYLASGRTERRVEATDVTTGGPSGGKERTNGFLFVAGSIRLGEEGVIRVAEVADLFFILAPRHLREREHWLRACQDAGCAVVARSTVSLEVPSVDALRDDSVRARFRRTLQSWWPEQTGAGRPVLLLDVHGELGAWFAAGDAAFVGGTLVPVGGHNLFEPAREGVPLAFGPHTSGVLELAEPLLRHGGGFLVRDADELCSWIARMAGDAGARARAGSSALAAAREVGGSVDRTWGFLEALPWSGARGAQP